MDRIWAPWRREYLSAVFKKQKGCLFCRIGKNGNDKAEHVFLRWKHCYAILNLYPYNNGHVLIVPYRHVADITKMTENARKEFFDLLNYVKILLDDVLHPEGYNIGMNLGHAAGAGVPKHLHMHIVPRWVGDVNFMPVIGQVKVISQSLDDLYQALVQADKKRRARS